MTELDFDELDKAVNNLMAERGAEELTTANASDTTVSITPAVTPIPTTPISTPTPTPASPASPAQRRRGQFMDVIRPSANRPAQPPQVRAEGLKVTPPTIQESATPDTEAVTSEPSPSPLPPVVHEEPTPVNPVEQPAEPQAWPDPIDMAQDVQPKEAEVPGDVATGQAHEEPNGIAPELPVEDGPLTSPFLPDAKVEKRPLGSVSPTVDLMQELSSPDDVDAKEEKDESDATNVAETAEPVTPTTLPDELAQDVVAVEANEVIHDAATASEPTQVQSTPATDVPALDTPLSGGAITQQYQEQASTGDQTNGAIYDTNTYHQPLDAKPAKKKSPVLAWVLWIVVLLIVGATAGAAWFYFTTQ